MSDFDYELASLIAPVTAQELIERFWDRRPLFVPGPADKLAGLFDRASWESICERRARAGDRGRTVGAFVTPAGEQLQFPVAPASAPTLSRLVTVCSARAEEDDPKLARLVAMLKAELGLLDKVVVNCYVSPAEQGYALHYDAQDVLVLQIEGAKRWRYAASPVIYSPHEYPVATGEGTVESPALGKTLRLPDEETLEEIVLEPGSMLYLPGGTWHVARAEVYSLALTVTFVPKYLARFLCEVLQALLLTDPSWRRRIPPVPASARTAGAIPETVAAFLDAELERLRDAVHSLDPSVLHQAWRHHMDTIEAAAPRVEPPLAGGRDPEETSE